MSRNINFLRHDVEANCLRFIDLMAAEGHPVLVTCTTRTDAEQLQLYQEGRSNAKTPSFHSEAAGLAFDICKNVKGQEYSDNAFWEAAGRIGKAMGFTWGGDWKSIVDKPHFQWDDHGKFTSSMILAGKYPPPMPRFEEEEMTEAEVIEIIRKYEAQKAKEPLPAWAKKEMDEAIKLGITDGSNPCALIPRYQAAIMALRAIRK